MYVKQASAVSLLLGMIIFGVIFVAVRDIPDTVTQESTEDPFQSIIDAQTKGDSSLEWLESENLEYKYGVREVKVKWYNNSNYWILFGTRFTLERRENSEWISINDKISISRIFLGIGFSLMPNKTYWYSYPVEMFTLRMVEGEYRIRAEYSLKVDNNTKTERFYTYAYFSVTGEDVKRKMTVLDPSKIEYVNGQYGFSVQLPKSWEGYSVITELVTGADKAVPVYRAIDEEYVSMKIRHPSWSEETPYQDISIVIFSQGKWSNNKSKAIKEAGIELPQNLRSKFLNDYIILPDMYNLNPSAEGYVEIMEIFDKTYKLPFGEGFGGY